MGGEGRRREEESLQGTACAIQEYCYPPESVSAGTSHSAPSLGREGREGGGKIGGGGVGWVMSLVSPRRARMLPIPGH